VGEPLTAVDGVIEVRRPEVDEAALGRYEVDGAAWRRRAAAARDALGAVR
jgi:O-succinylbenzoate synthase